jgi:CheY-like chemotaxis protein
MVVAPHATLTGKRILVVEDDYFIAKGLSRALRALGADVVGPAASVPDALALISPGHLDGRSLDINLRDEAGYAVADALTERGIPFVLTTGYADDALPDRYAAVPRCQKPIQIDQLVTGLFGPVN